MCDISSMQSPEIGEIAADLAAAQAELPAALKKSVNPHLKNRYADINSIYEAIRDVLPKHGLAVIQTMLPTDGSKAHVRTMLAHKSGQWLAGECVMPLDRQGGAQGMGSAITYARRYSLAAIVGVVADEDDDGNGAQGRGKAQAQREAIHEARERAKAENPDPPSTAQMKALATILSKRHGSDREARLREMESFTGRKLSSCNELTKDEVSDYIDAVQNGAAQAEVF